MGALLFYDTETTGLPIWKSPSNHPDQPHICQLTALLTDLDGEKISSMDMIVRLPDGVHMDARAEAAHGLSIPYCQGVGVPIADAMEVFLRLWEIADMRIGHQESFDARMIRIEMLRLSTGLDDAWQKGTAFCTMHNSRDLCQIPPTDKMAATNRLEYKTPTLGEAYQHFTGQELGDKAHNAMFDVMACKTVFFGIQAAGGNVNGKAKTEKPKAPETPTEGLSLFGDG